MRFHIGCSGWLYKYWRGYFYPKDVPLRKWFEYYAGIFDTVELNTTFYHLPKEQTIKTWKEKPPKDFCYAVKASKLITHYKRLKNIEDPLAVFLDRVSGLGKRLGPILYQLPEKFGCDYQLLESFLRLLPRKFTHVFELRNKTWWTPEIFQLLDKYHAGFCVYLMEDVKTPVVAPGNIFYMRFHGPIKRYRGAYTNRQLGYYARKILASGARSAWVYFNNTDDRNAYTDAQKLQKIVKRLQTKSKPGKTH